MDDNKKVLDTLKPLFDEVEYFDKNVQNYGLLHPDDYLRAISFLKSYNGSLGTFNSYRREIERFYQWSWLIAEKSIKELKRDHIENYIRFCQNPPKSWIGLKKVPRFIEVEGKRVPNSAWRPFVVTVSKAEYRKGKKSNINRFELTSSSIKQMLAILGSFYNYLLQEEYVLRSSDNNASRRFFMFFNNHCYKKYTRKIQMKVNNIIVREF